MQRALEIIIGGLLQGGAFALVGLGFALIFRVTGSINLAQGAFVVVGALLLYTFHQVLMWPLAIAFIASLAATVLVGTLLAQFVLEPALRKLPTAGMVLLTAGLLTFFEGAILLCWGSQPYQLLPFSGSHPYEVFGLRFPTQAPWDAAATILIVVALWYVLQKTSVGKALRAVSENPAAAALMGINVKRMTILSYAVASGIGGIAGMVIGPIVSLQFDSGGVFTNAGFISVTVGGIASFFGAIVGGLWARKLDRARSGVGYISSLFSTTIALVLLLAMLIWRPTGIIAGRIRRREDVRDMAHNPEPGFDQAQPSARPRARSPRLGTSRRRAATAQRDWQRRLAQLARDRGHLFHRLTRPRRTARVLRTSQPRSCGVHGDGRLRCGH